VIGFALDQDAGPTPVEEGSTIENFEFGLDVILAGLASRACGTGSRPPRRRKR
jgi:hypothetical protein